MDRWLRVNRESGISWCLMESRVYLCLLGSGIGMRLWRLWRSRVSSLRRRMLVSHVHGVLGKQWLQHVSLSPRRREKVVRSCSRGRCP